MRFKTRASADSLGDHIAVRCEPSGAIFPSTPHGCVVINASSVFHCKAKTQHRNVAVLIVSRERDIDVLSITASPGVCIQLVIRARRLSALRNNKVPGPGLFWDRREAGDFERRPDDE
jgi:hypothetical protein